MRLHHYFVALALFSLSFSPQSVLAKRKLIEVDRQITIEYKSKGWNIDPKKIDTAFVVFRDGTTNRLVQIQLEETAPDSGEFVGRFAIHWADTDKISPEIFIPPQEMKGNTKKVYDMVNKGQLPRKPIILKNSESGNEKIIVVYDRREDAEKAWAEYQKTLKERESKLVKPIPPREDREAAEKAEYNNKLLKMAQEAGERETMRRQLESSERDAIKMREIPYAKLGGAERQARKDKANKIAAEALALYNAGNYVDAEKKYHEAIETDPTNLSFYFHYGVCQFRNESLNPALVSLRIAPDEPKTVNEKRYFIGLIHLKLKELDAAEKVFEDLSKTDDPNIGSSALFYKGVIQFTKEDYESAKKTFEDVIDQSQDPKLDTQAEQLIEQIASIMAFKKLQEKKFTITGTVGVMYDSNVLLAPDNQQSQGSTTNKDDFRLNTIAALDYRPVLNSKYEATVKGTANLTNSSNANLSTADPWVYTFEAPLTYKGIVWKKGFKGTVKPGYEMLYMALDANGSKNQLLSSPYIAFDNTFVLEENWFSNYVFQYRQDNSSIPYTTSGDNATATLYTLNTTQTIVLDKANQEALVLLGGITYNSAVGDNKTFERFGASAIYGRPIGKYGFAFGILYYYLTYPVIDPSQGREDHNITILTSLSRPVKDWVTFGVDLTYADNASTQQAYAYHKLTVMTKAVFSSLF